MRFALTALCLTLTACSSTTVEAPADEEGAAGGAGVSTGSGGSGGSAKPDSGTAGKGGSSGGSTGGAAGASGAPRPGDAGPPPPADVVAPATKWVNVTNNLATLAAGGGDISVISGKPGTTRVIAGVGKGKGLFATDDGGQTWTALGTGTGSDTINNGPTAVIYDPDHPATFWEVGIYGDGVFRTTDDGQTFTHLGDSNHNDLVSVDFTDPNRQTMLLGPHETKSKLFLSSDGGDSWTDIGGNLPAGSNFSTLPQIIDTKTFLVGSAGWGGGTSGVFRSTDGGATWTSATSEGPDARPLWASSGTLYWTLVNDAGMITSADGGKTWTKTAAGPVSIYYSSSPVELPDGRIVALGKNNLLATSDGGKTWKQIGDPLPFPGANCGTYSVTYSAWLKTFFINHNDCSGNVASSSIWSSGFDYTTQ
jgi:photosystem II stability/assembly factor-like uncharacterized protein